MSAGLIVAYLIILGLLFTALCHIWGLFKILTDMQRAEEEERREAMRDVTLFYRTR